MNKRARTTALAAALVIPFATAAYSACAAPTYAEMTLLSEFRCENVAVQLFAAPTLAQARKNAESGSSAPSATVALKLPPGTGGPLRTCDADAPEAIGKALNNLGTLTLQPGEKSEYGAVVAVAEIRIDSTAEFVGGTVCRLATASSNPYSNENCVRAEAQFAYVPNTPVRFSLRLTSACLGVNCGQKARCEEGVCVEDSVPVGPRPDGGADGGGTAPPQNVALVCKAGVSYADGIACGKACISKTMGTETRSCIAASALCAPAEEVCCASVATAVGGCCVPDAKASIGTSETTPRIFKNSGGPTVDVCASNGRARACFQAGSADCPTGQVCKYRPGPGYGICISTPMRCAGGNIVNVADGSGEFCNNFNACLSDESASVRRLTCRYLLPCLNKELKPCCATSGLGKGKFCCLANIGGLQGPVTNDKACAPDKIACFKDSDCDASKPPAGTWSCRLESSLGWGSCGPK